MRARASLSSAPSLPPAPPPCVGGVLALADARASLLANASERERACHVHLAIGPCGLAALRERECVRLDRVYYYAALAFECRDARTGHVLATCVRANERLMRYARAVHVPFGGVLLSTGRQLERSDSALPFPNAPAMQYGGDAQLVVDANARVRWRHAPLHVHASPVSEYTVVLEDAPPPPAPPALADRPTVIVLERDASASTAALVLASCALGAVVVLCVVVVVALAACRERAPPSRPRAGFRFAMVLNRPTDAALRAERAPPPC
jgi:hypothetical protein